MRRNSPCSTSTLYLHRHFLDRLLWLQIRLRVQFRMVGCTRSDTNVFSESMPDSRTRIGNSSRCVSLPCLRIVFPALVIPASSFVHLNDFIECIADFLDSYGLWACEQKNFRFCTINTLIFLAIQKAAVFLNSISECVSFAEKLWLMLNAENSKILYLFILLYRN
jgi:hypothetical protein